MGRYAVLLLVLFAACQRDPVAAPTGGKSNGRNPGPGLVPAKEKAAAGNASGADLRPAKEGAFADWPKPAVALVVTGQQLGYIEPCGCTGLENQKGGLARRQTLIRQLVKERGWPAVALDVGSQVKGFGKQQEIKFAHAVQGLRAMGYRAIALGEGDLRLTPGELLSAMAGADGNASDFVSANVAVLGRELQPQFIVVEAGGKRIGVTSVLGAKFEERLSGDELVHERPLAALKKVSEELTAKKCDFLVLLAHAPLDEARKLAEQAPVFDLVVASGETSLPSNELEAVAGTKTRLMQVGLKAMYVGIVGVFDNPKQPVRYESVPLDARFADSPEMLKLLADYQEQLKDLGLEGLGVKPQPHPSGRRFVGSETCGECHTKAFAKWKETTHAKATDSLVKPPNNRGNIPRHYDPECLSCHVTGWEPQKFFPYESGYLSLEKTPRLTQNGCENCHGPGSAHVAAENGQGNSSAEASARAIAKLRSEMRLPLSGGAAERKCIECHDLDNSPDFHKEGAFEKYWKQVEHLGKD